VSSPAVQHRYTIRDAAALTGLPASTLRYYETIGVITPISRGASSGHRLYDEADLDQLMAISFLAATGMSVGDMRQYVANNQLGPSAARQQVELLTAQAERLELEAAQVALRHRYVRIKIDYWDAVEAGDAARTTELTAQARALADDLQQARKK
jgi:DNA-binding transcriptional MerR regulator